MTAGRRAYDLSYLAADGAVCREVVEADEDELESIAAQMGELGFSLLEASEIGGLSDKSRSRQGETAI